MTWTFETLLEHLNARLDAADRRYEQRFKDNERATETALTAIDKRLENMNEIRSMAQDQQRINMPRLEAEQRFKAIEERMTTAEQVRSSMSGQRRGAADLWGWIAGIIGIVVALISLWFRTKG